MTEFQQEIAKKAVGNLYDFVVSAISSWSRLVTLFRSGVLPENISLYHEVSRSPLPSLISDSNATASGFGEMAIGLSLFGGCISSNNWKIGSPESTDISAGAFTCTGGWAGSVKTRIFFVKSATEALMLKKSGGLAERNTVVVHSDDAWLQFNAGSSRRSTRNPGGSVGRDGNYEARHISLKELIDNASNYADVKMKFVEAVTILSLIHISEPTRPY